MSIALTLNLNGKALIEASAGTGKTWTLTTIILRLLLETSRPPQEIIATTFTRKAAAEMQRRINENFDLYRQQYEQLNQNFDLEALPDDGFNHHLFKTYHETESLWIYLGQRFQIVSREINHLFINTLDALCQRWLNEYALETGVNEHLKLIENNNVALGLIHDDLRKYYQEIYPKYASDLSAYFQEKSTFLDTEEIEQATKKGDTFGRAILDPVENLPEKNQNNSHKEALFAEFDLIDWNQWHDFLNQFQFISGTYKSTLFIQNLKTEHLNSNDLEKLKKISDCHPKFFKKGGEKEFELFKQHPYIRLFREIHQIISAQKKISDLIAEQALFRGLNLIREEYPKLLEKYGQTTYSENLKRLNQALKNGGLALYIRHRYPILLVDESQDLNQEQAILLEQIYFNHSETFGFLLLVGDPKQAIYRFRGGDVTNYNRLKKRFAENEIYQLLDNYRSSPNLIQALNHHYLSIHPNNRALGEGIFYHPISSAKPQRNIQDFRGKTIEKPLIFLEIDKKEDELEALPALIKHLTAENSLFSNQGTRINPNEIMVLAPQNDHLLALSEALINQNIPCEIQSENSIFKTEMAEAFAFLLQAFLRPNDKSTQNALLASLFFRRDFKNLHHSTLQAQLNQALLRWQHSGLLASLHEFLHHFDIWTTLTQAPEPNNTRYIIDLRAIFEIVARFAPRFQPLAFYGWWQMHCHQPPTEADWANAPALPAQNAVRLMTIHKSKGLQAPVVILAGLKGGRKGNNPEKIKHYQLDNQTHLSANKTLSSDLEALYEREIRDEQARNLYVAVTRAEDLLFVLSKKDKSEVVQNLFGEGLSPFSDRWEQLPNGQNQVSLPLRTPQIPEALPPLPSQKRVFFGWGRTSFTALSAGKIESDSPDFEAPEPEIYLPEPTDLYRFNFPKGAEAGTFLHKLLEKLNPQRPDTWAREIKKSADRYPLLKLNEGLTELLAWLHEIYETPLVSGLNLKEIQYTRRELGFTIHLADNQALDAQALNELFAQYKQKLYLSADKRHYRFLRGEIDLVYRHNNRYYIVDYKSNFLGNRQEDYQQKRLQEAMWAHQYPLQASIYQLALYRLLRQRPDFHPDQLGEVEYAFLRGMSKTCRSTYIWQMPFDFIEKFDALLGGG